MDKLQFIYLKPPQRLKSSPLGNTVEKTAHSIWGFLILILS